MWRRAKDTSVLSAQLFFIKNMFVYIVSTLFPERLKKDSYHRAIIFQLRPFPFSPPQSIPRDSLPGLWIVPHADCALHEPRLPKEGMAFLRTRLLTKHRSVIVYAR